MAGHHIRCPWLSPTKHAPFYRSRVSVGPVAVAVRMISWGLDRARALSRANFPSPIDIKTDFTSLCKSLFSQVPKLDMSSGIVFATQNVEVFYRQIEELHMPPC